MANVIIGTAGHIDHGKTTLIKRLTGIDTDRLAEEKKRGITIELGFAYFDLPSGKRAGIVDVPGHEKFIKNMLAGAGGIDIVLLVVSAEEGFMPQTQEHFDILDLLDIKHGIIVMTKCDLVDKDWIDAVKEEIRDKVKGSFLENSSIVEVSAYTGYGMDQLVNEIDKVIDELQEKNDQASPRLPIDRVFTMTGFGTIVTGTLIEGKINEGDLLELYPSNLEARVRRIQVHGKDQPTAFSGQRVAVNIANLSKEQINRGDILAKPGSLKDSSILDAQIRILPSYGRNVLNWQRLRLYHGSREVLCRLVLLESQELVPGEEAFVQLRLEEPTACKYGDHFVLRLFSPLETLGGGIILDPNANKHKRFKNEVIDELMNKSMGDHGEIVINALIKRHKEFSDVETLSSEIGFSEQETSRVLDELVEAGEVVRISKKIHIHKITISEIENELIAYFNEYHGKNPMRKGIPKEELRSKLFKNIKGKTFDEVLGIFIEKGVLISRDSLIAINGFEIKLSDDQNKHMSRFIDELEKGGMNPPFFTELLESSGISPKDKQFLEYLVDDERVVKLQDNLMISKKNYDKAVGMVYDYFDKETELTLGGFRDIIESSRKVAVPLLELLDQNKITIRRGDSRVKCTKL